MKHHSPHRIVASFFNFLCCLLLGLCLLSLPARATIPSGLTLSSGPIGSGVGSHAYNVPPADSFTVVGTGDGVFSGGVGSHLDNDYFAYYAWTGGDVEIVARLVSFNNPLNGQAGLMIRKSNTSGEVNTVATWFWPNLNGTGAIIWPGPAVARRWMENGTI